MIRRTVAKAFGPGGAHSTAADFAGALQSTPVSRTASLNSLFSSLQVAFERAIAERPPGVPGPSAPGGPAAGASLASSRPPPAPPLRPSASPLPARAASAPPPRGPLAAAKGEIVVSRIHTRIEGLEFTVDGPSGSFRFLNSLEGFISIEWGRRGLFQEDRLLTIYFAGGVPRPIERPAGVQRAPFKFTSVPQLVRELLARVR